MTRISHLPLSRNRHHNGVRRNMGCDGRDDGDRAVPVPDVFLDDDHGPGFPDLVPSGRIEFDEVDFASPGKGHARFGFVSFFDSLEFSNAFQASSSSGNHSAAISRSRLAFTR